MRIRLLAVLAVIALAITACGTNGTATTDDVAATPTPDTDTDTGLGTDADPAEESSPVTDEDIDADTDTDVGATGEGDAQTIIQAADTTLEEGSAAFTAEVVLEGEEGTDAFTSSGEIDFEGDRRQAVLVTAAGDVTALTTQEGLLLSLGEDAEWFRVDPRELRGTPLETFGLASLPLQDPSLNLALLRATTGDVAEVGGEDLDGESVTRYSITVDAEQAAAQADSQTRESISALVGTEGMIPMEVWVDEDDRIRRIQHQTDLTASELVEGQPEGSVQVTIDFDDFGRDIDIADPDEDQITDIDEQSLELLIRQAITGT